MKEYAIIYNDLQRTYFLNKHGQLFVNPKQISCQSTELEVVVSALVEELRQDPQRKTLVKLNGVPKEIFDLYESVLAKEFPKTKIQHMD